MEQNKEETKKIIEEAIVHIQNAKDLEELQKKLEATLTKEFLSLITKELITRRKKAAAAKRAYNKRGEMDLSIEKQTEIKELKEAEKRLSEIKRNVSAPEAYRREEKKSIGINERKQHLIEEINAINYWVSKEAKELVEEYAKSQMANEKIIILRHLEKIYKEATQELDRYKKETFERIKNMVAEDANIKRNRATTKKVLYDKLNTKEYKPFQEKLEALVIEVKKAHHILKDITTLIDLENKQIKDMTKLEFTNEDLIESKDFLEPRNKTEQELQRILRRLESGKYLQKYGYKLENGIPEEIANLLSDLQDLPKKELEELTYLAEDIIKKTRKGIKKGQSASLDLEKEFLRLVEKEFVKIRPIFYEYEEDTSIYYEILYKLIQDDRNYPYIKNLLEIEEFQRARKEGIKKNGNSRKKIEKTEKEHFVLLLLDEFIKNYKLALLDQNLEYQSPDFYKEIIKLFINKEVDLLPRELTKYTTRLNEFSQYVKGKGYQTTSKVLEDIEELIAFQKNSFNNVDYKETFEKIDDATKEELYQYSLDEGVKHNNRLKYPTYQETLTCKTFKINGVEPFAFSISYLPDGSKNIGIHILDTTKIVNFNDLLQKELETNTLSLPTFTEDKLYPTMLFQCLVTKEGKLKKAAITPANLKISKTLTSKDLDNYREVLEAKEFEGWLALLQEKLELNENRYQETSITKIVSTYLSEMLAYNFTNNSIPFIYKSALPEADRLILKNHNEIVSDLMKVSKHKSHKIFEVLDQVTESYYVSEKTTDSTIELNPGTETGVYLLNTLHKFERETYEPEEAAEEVRGLLTKLNSKREYVPSCLNNINDKNVKQMIRRYKKAAKVASNS